ncbi:MAG: N-acetylglucosamine-6-phosphate deacetylase [Thermoanaerobaculia bacterium]
MAGREILRGRAWAAGAIQDDVVVVMEEGRFADVRFASRVDDPAPNVGDGVMVPGLIDLHVHGAAGADFMDGTEDAVHAVCAHHLRHGTTTIAPTTLSGSREAIAAALASIAAAAARQSAAEATIAGVHLEGPYLHPSKCGAQDPASLRAADIHEMEGWRALAPDLPWIMTVAPELDGVLALIERFHGDVTFSIGHTTADYGQTLAAIEAGASHFTHLFNAMPPLHHREPGPVGAALADSRCTVELVADGVHLHPAILHTVAAQLFDRTVLVTDAMRACGMPEGTYRLYRHDVIVKDGAARLANGALAGSVLTMRDALRNMVELAGLPLETVIPLATEIPARVLGADRRKGRIAPGYDADLLVLSPRFAIERIFRGGVALD